MMFNFLKLESKNVLSKRYCAILVIFFIIIFFFLQDGIIQYKQILDEKKVFQEYEKMSVKQYFKWYQYGAYGFRLLFVPSPFISFYNTGAIPNDLTAFIDSGYRLNIYKTMMGKSALFGFKKEYMNFTGFILLLGSLMALFYGFFAFSNKEWLKFMEGFTGSKKKLFLYLIASRIVILLAFCILLATISKFFFFINGLSIDEKFLLILFLGIFLMLLFFLFIGFCLGVVKNMSYGVIGILITWISLVFILPWLISNWVYTRSEEIKSSYYIEAEKQKIIQDYEKRAREKYGKFDQTKRGAPNEKEMFFDFWDSGHKESIRLENDMLESIKSKIEFYQNIAGLFPSTFFQSFCNELSSTGLNSLMSFYDYSHKMKNDFLWFYSQNYILSSNPDVVSFIKSDENVYQGKSTLPGNTGFGFVVCLLWLVLLTCAAWVGFNRLDGKPGPSEIITDDLKANRTTILMTSNPVIYQGLLSILRFQKINFLAVPSPGSIPGDINIRSLFSFFSLGVPEKLQKLSGSYLQKLNPDQKAFAIIEIVKSKKADVIIFQDFVVGLSDSFQEYFLDELKEIKRGCRVVYFSTSLTASGTLGDDVIRFTKEKLF